MQGQRATLTKIPQQVKPKNGKAVLDVSTRADFRKCVKAVLGDVPDEVLELWTEALFGQNKVLFEFLDARLGNKVNDSNVVIQFQEINEKPPTTEDTAAIKELTLVDPLNDPLFMEA